MLKRFQCSSASRKFLNKKLILVYLSNNQFQCSSASRKFLNITSGTRSSVRSAVSVLFSEPKIPQFNQRRHQRQRRNVSVLFSEPKIPQRWISLSRYSSACRVSVLFSEPKIPQPVYLRGRGSLSPSFSALQRAENSSIFSRLYLSYR